MKEINIAELLKDCPNGMELDCTMYEDVYFDYVDELNIIHCYIKNESFKTSITFNQHGTPNSYIKSKCVIFPKGKTTWEGFVPTYEFKDGDIVVDDSGAIFFYRQIHPYYEEPYADFYCGVTSELRGFVIKTSEASRCGKISSIRYATEEEKQILFGAIKERGYKWNAETKTLEKLIIPKFKVGDRIKSKVLKSDVNTITKVCDNHYELDDGCALALDYQDNWELAPNKFDINTLIPFESKVLVRAVDNQFWRPAIWGVKHKDWDFCCVVGGEMWEQCIPYEGNEHLLGKSDDCVEYFKTWK